MIEIPLPVAVILVIASIGLSFYFVYRAYDRHVKESDAKLQDIKEEAVNLRATILVVINELKDGPLTRLMLIQVQHLLDHFDDSPIKQNFITQQIRLIMKQFELLNGTVTNLEDSVTRLTDSLNNGDKLTDEQAQALAVRIGDATNKLSSLTVPDAPATSDNNGL